jgi:hypothetical protein
MPYAVGMPRLLTRTKALPASEIGLLCGLCVLLLFPILTIGFANDDNYNYYTRGFLELNHMSFWSFILIVNHSWLEADGRLFPGAIVSTYAFFYFFHEPLVCKIVLLICIVANILTLWWLSSYLYGRRFAFLAVLCTILAFQIRFFADGLISYSLLMQLVVELNLLSTLFLCMGLARQQRLLIVLGATTFVLGALTYEVTFALAVIPAFIILRALATPAIRRFAAVAYGAPLVALLGIVTVLRSVYRPQSIEYQVSSNVLAYGHSLLTQSVAAIPLSYSLLAPAPAPNWEAAAHVQSILPLIVGLLAALLMYYGFYVPRDTALADHSDVSAPFITIPSYAIGLCLWIVPAAVIALSQYHQIRAAFGLGYIQCYLEYFGVGMVLASILVAIPTAVRRVRWSVAVVSIATGALFCVSANSIGLTAQLWLPIWTWGSAAVEDAAKSGLFTLLPPDALIVLDRSTHFFYAIQYDSSGLLYLLSGRQFRVAPPEDIEQRKAICTPLPSGDCVLHEQTFQYQDLNQASPYTLVSVSDISSIGVNDGVGFARTRDGFIFAAPGAFPKLTGSTGLSVISRSLLGTVFSYRKCLETATSQLLAMPVAAPTSVLFGSGFYPADADTSGPFRVSSHKSFFSLRNDARSSANVRFSFRASIGVVAPGVLYMSDSGTSQAISLTNAGESISIERHLASGASVRVGLSYRGQSTHSPGDPRDLAFRIDDMSVHNSACP